MVSSADTIPVSDLLPEVLRSLPFASPTVSLQLRQELQQELSLSQPEILAAIIRAHSESFQTSHLTTDQSEKSVPFLRKFFKLVLSSGKDARLQNLQNQISEKIRMIIPRDSKSEIAAYSACVEILVNAYFQNQISGQYIARKALEAQKALQNRKKS